jgi:hypothetical protein
VARAKLNLDLFERRLRIYRATDKYLLESLSGGPQGFLDSIEGLDAASFIFGSEVCAGVHSGKTSDGFSLRQDDFR